jgi:hypothetical protein
VPVRWKATNPYRAGVSPNFPPWRPREAVEKVHRKRGHAIFLEIKARERRRISGFIEDLATQISWKRAGRSRSDFFNGLQRNGSRGAAEKVGACRLFSSNHPGVPEWGILIDEAGPGQQRSGSEPCTEITVPTEGRFRAWGALRSCFITSFCCDRLQEPPAASSGQKRPQQPYQAASGPFCPRSLLAALSLDLATKQVMKQLL